tara:strand:- start:2268 stop:9149 length:6882 start_codon:yes stop_codon:yes gene_type:complete
MDIQDPQNPEPEVVPELQNPEPEQTEQEPKESKRVFQQTEDFPTFTQAAREKSFSEKEFGTTAHDKDKVNPYSLSAYPKALEDSPLNIFGIKPITADLMQRAALTTITGNAYLKSQAPDFDDDVEFFRSWTPEYYAKVMTGIAEDEQPWIRDSSSEAEVQWKRESVLLRMKNEVKLAEYGFTGSAVRLLADLSDPIFLGTFAVGAKFAQSMIGAKTIFAGSKRYAQAQGRFNQVYKETMRGASAEGLAVGSRSSMPAWEAQAWASQHQQAVAASWQAAHKILVQPTILERSIISGVGFGTTELARAHVNPLIHDDDVLHAIGAGMVFGAGHGVVNKIWQKFMHSPPVFTPFESSKGTRPMEPRGGGWHGSTPQRALPEPPRLLPHPDVVIPPVKPRGPLALPEPPLRLGAPAGTVAPKADVFNMTPEIVDDLIRNASRYSAHNSVAEMSPIDYVRATTTKEAYARILKETKARWFDKGATEVFDPTGMGRSGSNSGIPSLRFKPPSYVNENLDNARSFEHPSLGRVSAHDGRHRMMALHLLGIKKAPVRLLMENAGENLRYLGDKMVEGQSWAGWGVSAEEAAPYMGGDAVLKNIIPLTEGNRAEILNMMGKPAAPKAPVPTSTDTFVGLPNGTVVKVPNASVDPRTAFKSWEVLTNLSPKTPMEEALKVLKSKGVTKNEIAFVGSGATRDLQKMTEYVGELNKGDYHQLSNSIMFTRLVQAYPKQAEEIVEYKQLWKDERKAMELDLDEHKLRARKAWVEIADKVFPNRYGGDYSVLSIGKLIDTYGGGPIAFWEANPALHQDDIFNRESILGKLHAAMQAYDGADIAREALRPSRSEIPTANLLITNRLQNRAGIAPLKLPLPKSKATVQDLINDYSVPMLDVEVYTSAVAPEKAAELKALDMRRAELKQVAKDAFNTFKSDTNELIKAWFSEFNVRVDGLTPDTFASGSGGSPATSISDNIEHLRDNGYGDDALNFVQEVRGSESFKISELNYREASEALNAFSYSEKVEALRGPEETQAVYDSGAAFTGVDRTREVLLRATGDMFYMEGHFTGKKSLQLTDRGKNVVAHGRWGFEVGSEKSAVSFENQSANQNDLAVDRKEGRTSEDVEKRQMIAATWIAHNTQSMIIDMVKSGARRLRFADYNEVIAKSSQSSPLEAKGRHIYDVAVPSYLEKYAKALDLNLRTRLADKDAVEPAIFDTIKESFEAANISKGDIDWYINEVKIAAQNPRFHGAALIPDLTDYLNGLRKSIPNYSELQAQTDFNSLASLHKAFLEAKKYTQRTLHLTEYDAKRILESEGLFINPFVNKKGTVPKPKPRGEYELAIHNINLVQPQEQIDLTGIDLRQPIEIMADNPLLLDTSSLEGLSMIELRKIAEPLGVKGRSKLDLTAKIEAAREAEPKLYEPPTDLRPVLVRQQEVDNFPEIVNETGFVIVTDAVAAAAAGAGTPPPTVPPTADGTTPPPSEPVPEEPISHEATMALLSRNPTAGMMNMRGGVAYSWSFSAALGKPSAPLVLRFFHQEAINTNIAPELDGKTVPSGFGADMKADAYAKIDLTNVGELEGGAFDEWYLANKERFPLIGGADGVRKQGAQSDFYGLVFRGIEGEKVTDPLVQRSIDAFAEGYRVQAEAILESGMSETLLNHEGYATHSWKTGRVGENITLYTLDKMTELFNNALMAKNPTFTPRQSLLISKALLINVNTRGLDVDYESTNGIGEESYEAMKRKLSAIPNITEEEIANVMKAVEKGPNKPSFLRNRTELDVFATMKMRNEVTGELDDVSIIDMLDTNVKASFIHHTRRLRGQIAYRELGKEFNKYRGLSADAPHATWDDMKAILKRELLDRGENNAQALELFEHAQRVVLGIPIDPATSSIGEAARMLQKTALAAFGATFGLAATAEAGQAIAMSSVDSMKRMAPEIWQVFQDVFSGKMPTGEFARELQGFVGMAQPKWGRGTNMNREFDHILENSQGSVESFLDFVGEKALSYGGMFAIDTVQRYVTMMGFTDTLVNGVMDGGISPYSEILEKQIGWSSDMVYRVGKMILVHGKLYDAIGGGKKIGRAHPELWSDTEAAENFRWGGHKFVMRTIHTSQKGQYHHKFQGQLGRMFWQFRTFMLSAYEGQAVTAVQGMKHGDKRAAIALVTNSVFAGLSYIATILVRYGHDEEKMKKYLTKEQIMKGMLFKSGWFTLGAPITDTVMQLLGEDKVFSYAGTRSGLASDALMGSPSIAIANALAGTAKSLIAPVFNPSYQYSKQDWRNIKTLAPLHGLLGWGNALDAVPKMLDLPDSSTVKE